jgi:hypothetical protein
MTSKQFRELIAKAGLNQLQAAEVLEISPRTMRRYVAGKGPVPKMAVWTIVRYMEKRHESRYL